MKRRTSLGDSYNVYRAWVTVMSEKVQEEEKKEEEEGGSIFELIIAES